MDSLTQIALGAAVGQGVLGSKVGYRAALWGAVCGTLPDLDVFISMGGAVADFTYHRSFSHSLLILPLLSPLLVWLILKFHPQTADQRKGWYLLVLLALVTHPLLDSLTIYGTQLFWPLSSYPVGLGSIFIIDPFYTLPLLLGLIIALVVNGLGGYGRRYNLAGLALSSLYLAWSLVAQQHVSGVARESLANRGLGQPPLLVTPAPFNTLLWRVVAMEDGGFREGFYSLLDSRRDIRFRDYPSQVELLQGLQSHWPVSRLQWFSKGFYKVQDLSGEIVISDLRMGVEPDYVFRFKVAELSNPHPQPVADQRLPARRNWSRLPGMIERIWKEPE